MKGLNILTVLLGSTLLFACSDSENVTELQNNESQELQYAERRSGDMDRDYFKDKSPEEIAEHMTNRLSEKLELNDQQQIEVKAIILSFVQRMKELKSQERSKEKREVFKALAEENKAKMQEVLTPEQFDKFQIAMKKIKRRRGKEHVWYQEK